jgi:hypothetical protein
MKKSPLQTVHSMCLACGSQKELAECENVLGTKFECVLHPFRFGKNSKGHRLKLSIIKKYCKWCMQGLQLRECTSPECIFFKWRYGHNPNKAGKGNINNLYKVSQLK